jgi:RHS repeat-associated protein
VNPTYDGNGNLTYDGTFTYCYDDESRLTGALSAGTCTSPTTTVATYAYDAQGRRKAKTVGSTTTAYVTGADNREALEYNGTSGSGALLLWYSFALGPDNVLNQMNIAAGTRETLIPDIQGSLIGALDAASGALTKTGYQPYGENPGLTTATPPGFYFTGRRLDPETAGSTAQPSGLYYYHARHYSPTFGRFLQPDPAGYNVGTNLYAYVENDPLNNIDPNGLLGVLYSVGGTAEAGGLLGLEAAANANVGAGGFVNTSLSSNFGTISNGIFGGTTAFAAARPFGAGATGQTPQSVGSPTRTNPIVIGAFAGRGESVSLTTANNIADLAGPATVYNLNTPLFSLQFQVGTGTSGQSVYSLSLGTGGVGASISSYTTQTVTSPPPK